MRAVTFSCATIVAGKAALALATLPPVIVRPIALRASLPAVSVVFALVFTMVRIGWVLIVLRTAFLKRRLGVSWSTIVPHRGLLLPLGLSVLGIACTLVIDRWLAFGRLGSFMAAGAVWGVLLLATLWRQQLWRKLLGGAGRGSVKPSD